MLLFTLIAAGFGNKVRSNYDYNFYRNKHLSNRDNESFNYLCDVELDLMTGTSCKIMVGPPPSIYLNESCQVWNDISMKINTCNDIKLSVKFWDNTKCVANGYEVYLNETFCYQLPDHELLFSVM